MIGEEAPKGLFTRIKETYTVETIVEST